MSGELLGANPQQGKRGLFVVFKARAAPLRDMVRMARRGQVPRDVAAISSRVRGPLAALIPGAQVSEDGHLATVWADDIAAIVDREHGFVSLFVIVRRRDAMINYRFDVLASGQSRYIGAHFVMLLQKIEYRVSANGREGLQTVAFASGIQWARLHRLRPRKLRKQLVPTSFPRLLNMVTQWPPVPWPM